MSFLIIEDGTGTGKKASVNSDNRLEVQAVSTSELHELSHDFGNVFSIATDFVSFTTTDTETGVLYFKNTSTVDYFVHSIRTCGTQIQKIKMYMNPTTGTLISAASDATVVNMNMTSSNTLDCLAYKGVDGSTLTNGTFMGQHINDVGHSNEEFDGAMVIGSQQSIAITAEMPAAGDFCIRMVVYKGSF